MRVWLLACCPRFSPSLLPFPPSSPPPFLAPLLALAFMSRPLPLAHSIACTFPIFVGWCVPRSGVARLPQYWALVRALLSLALAIVSSAPSLCRSELALRPEAKILLRSGPRGCHPCSASLVCWSFLGLHASSRGGGHLGRFQATAQQGHRGACWSFLGLHVARRAAVASGRREGVGRSCAFTAPSLAVLPLEREAGVIALGQCGR